MSHEYVGRWKSEFEKVLTGARVERPGRFGWAPDVSMTIPQHEKGPTGEFVFRVPLREWGRVSLLMFTSVDKTTERTRPCDTDAVRVGHEWFREDGRRLYTPWARRSRTSGLPLNLLESLVEMSEDEALMASDPTEPGNHAYRADFAAVNEWGRREEVEPGELFASVPPVPASRASTRPRLR